MDAILSSDDSIFQCNRIGTAEMTNGERRTKGSSNDECRMTNAFASR